MQESRDERLMPTVCMCAAENDRACEPLNLFVSPHHRLCPRCGRVESI